MTATIFIVDLRGDAISPGYSGNFKERPMIGEEIKGPGFEKGTYTIKRIVHDGDNPLEIYVKKKSDRKGPALIEC